MSLLGGGCMSDLNPWLSIWTQPKATMKYIASTNPNRSLWLLSAIYGFPALLSFFQSLYLGYSLRPMALFLLALILSPIWGYVAFSFASFVILWVGKLFKGRGSFQEIRAAYAWSCVPLIVSCFFWVVLMFLFGGRLFISSADNLPFTNAEGVLLFSILIVKVVFAVWSLVIYLNALAEVQSFSILKSVGNVLVSAVFLIVVSGVVYFLSLYALSMAVENSNTAFQILNESKLIFSQVR